MAEGRKLEKLADGSFSDDVVKCLLGLHPQERRKTDDHEQFFRAILRVAVSDVLRDRGVPPAPFAATIRFFVNNLHVDDAGLREAGRLLAVHAPVPDSHEASLRVVLPSISRSVEQQTPATVQRLIGLFQLRLLALGLDLREQALLSQQEGELDPLTRLLNRRGMSSYLAELLRDQSQLSGAVLLLDADHFKRVNDTHGHASGDRALQYLADAVSRTIRVEPDVLARWTTEGLDGEVNPVAVRWGGEEIVALLPGVDTLEIARSIGERVRRAVETGARAALGFPITATIGATVGPFSQLDCLISTADRALYEGKESGRNRVVSKALSSEDSAE